MSSERIIEVATLPDKIETGATYSIAQNNPNSYTHGMFKYPCKFIPEIPRWGINSFLSNEKQTVFDPFAGSGTTLLEANVCGYNAYGTEIDEVAKLITKVKTTKLKRAELAKVDALYNNILVLLDGKKKSTYRPQINNLEHWFSEETINDLGLIKEFINDIDNVSIKNFFSVVFVSIIKRVSFADDTSPKPYVSNNIKKNPPSVEKEFASVFNRYRMMIEDLLQVRRFGSTQLIEGDALSFHTKRHFDIAISSPPYINAFDYGRTMRLENLWLGLLDEDSLREKKAFYVGTEKIKIKSEEDLLILEKSSLLEKYYRGIQKEDKKRALIVKKFFEDMEKNMQCVYSHLKPNSKYMIVIGNSSIRNIEIESWKVLEQIGHTIGFETNQYFNYEIKNPYIRIPRGGKGGKISKDYIIVLEKGDIDGTKG